MKITKNVFVSLDYTLTDDNGVIIDSSKDAQALNYIHGYQLLIPGMEKALEGRSAGEHFTITIPPAEAYGEVNTALIVEVSRQQFPANVEIKEGMQFNAGSDTHPRTVTVKEVQGDTVIIDANHPMAGKTLHFDVSILNTRQASDNEIAEVLTMLTCSNSCSAHSGGCGSCGGCG